MVATLDLPVEPLPVEGEVEASATWFADRITLDLAAPGLGGADHGLLAVRPETQRLVAIDGRPTVRIDMRTTADEALVLYLQPRPPTDPAVWLVTNDDGSIAYWRDCPVN